LEDVLATSQQPPSHTRARGSLAEALVTLAGTPDDVPTIDAQLRRLAQVAADRVACVDYASITALRDNAYVTVAASSDLALAVDQAQYADDDGPCLRSLQTRTPVTVPDIAATMAWPGFRDAATGLGLHASVSIPLVAGSGATIAVLNCYGRDPDAMALLIAGLAVVYDPSRPLPPDILPAEDTGGGELLAGVAEALSVHDTIQRAVGVIMAQTDGSAADAYVTLRLRAADAGVSLLATANMIIQQAV
jgi:hypothetical protein